MQSLKPRLNTILRSVPEGSLVADIGTDHAFLPIALIKSGIAKRVLACDVSEGPLLSARENIKKSKVENIELRLSDGLEKISENEADVIVVAGMGGDLIRDIISRAEWLENPDKLLILQPMTSADALRVYLYESGFFIQKESPVEDSGRVYTVMTARFDGKKRKPTSAETFIGKLASDNSDAAHRYIKLQYSRVKNCAESLKSVERKTEEYLFWDSAKKELKEIIDKFGT